MCDHFKFGQNNTQNEQTNDNTLKSATCNQTTKFAQAVIDPNEITVCFKNADSQNTPKDSPNTPALFTKPVDKQGHSKKLESFRNVPWFACQDLKGVLPKRVSFNDIPDVIASQEVGNERFLANHEAGWNSHCSENDAGHCK